MHSSLSCSRYMFNFMDNAGWEVIELGTVNARQLRSGRRHGLKAMDYHVIEDKFPPHVAIRPRSWFLDFVHPTRQWTRTF
jgi:hypothetical protein